MFAFQCSVVNFPLLTAALKEYASDSAIDLVGMIRRIVKIVTIAMTMVALMILIMML